MEEQDKNEIPLVGMHVKEETPSKLVLEWWNRLPQKSNPFEGAISFLKGIFSISTTGSTEKESSKDNLTPEEIVTIDLEAQHATRVNRLKTGETEQIDLDLKLVSQVRVQMEEHGHHFRLYLDSPDNQPFQVSIAFINSSYSTDDLVAHGRKIGKLLNKPVIRQHTDTGSLISEETIQEIKTVKLESLMYEKNGKELTPTYRTLKR